MFLESPFLEHLEFWHLRHLWDELKCNCIVCDAAHGSKAPFNFKWMVLFSAIWMCHKEKSCQSDRLTWRTWAYLRHPTMPLQRFARMELWSLGAPRKLEATRERSKTSCKMSKRSRRRGVRPGMLSSKPQPTAFLARGLIFESVR